MQTVAIFLCKTGIINKFRQVILNSLRLQSVDNALICSGFFQEDSIFSAGTEIDILCPYRCVPLRLTALGIYSYSWRSQFNSFITMLKTTNPCKLFTVTQKRVKGMRWHAKIFIAKESSVPVVAIIGSSNITRRAFGVAKDFNYECDVVIWDKNNSAVNKAIELAIGDILDTSDVIVTQYDPSHRANQESLVARIQKLEKEILEKAIDV